MGYFKFFSAGRSLAIVVMLGTALAPALPANALVPVGGGGGGSGGGGGGGGGSQNNGGPSTASGPGLPYISGRLGGARQAPSAAPGGTVVPDDFCLPGKFDDCGSHLRNGPVIEEQGPIFVGQEDLAFFQAKNSAWVNGDFRQTTNSNLSETRQLTAFSIGADRKFGDAFTFGAMLVSSQSTVDFGITGIQDRATGIYAGPYFSFRLSDRVFLDGRFYLGSSDHDIITGGAQTGTYQSQDSFAALRISADIDRGNWSVFPSLEFAQVKQNDAAYTDGIRGAIAAVDSSQSYFTVAALGYYNGLDTMTPYLGMEISQDISASSLSGTFRAGTTLGFDNGSQLNVDYAFGGIGLSGVDDQQVSFRFEFPF